MGRRLVVIGGGSTYTPELIEGVLVRQEWLLLDEIALVDTNPDRLQILGGLTERMVRRFGLPVRVRLTGDRRSVLPGADFVVSQIRVGGTETRARDEEFAAALGLLGQETTGPVGFAKARRTIPEVWRIARDVAELCPDAWLINFTNPAGLVTEALYRRFPKLKVVGLCNVPPNMKRAIAAATGVDPTRISLDYVGLNHLSWARAAWVDGEDVLPEALRRLHEDQTKATEHYRDFPPRLLEDLGCLPSPYLRYYYMNGLMMQRQRHEEARGRQVAEIERELLSLYADPGLDRPPEELGQRGGAWYSEAAAGLMASLAGGAPGEHIVNVPNGRTIAGLPESAVVEVAVEVRDGHLVPRPVRPVEPALLGLMQQAKAYEQLTVEALMQGDDRLARLALLSNPLVWNANLAYRFYDQLVEWEGPVEKLLGGVK